MTSPFKNQFADIIFSNGDIITVDDRYPEAMALAVGDGKILAIGDPKQMRSRQGPDTQIIDLAGKTVMPGLIEPHSHPILSAMLYDWIDVSGFTHADGATVINSLRKGAAGKKDGEWVLAFGYDPILTRDLKSLNADLLDDISTTCPILVLVQTMHTAYVNHKALEMAGIDDNTPQPPGGQFVKDKNNRLTGMVIEQAGILPFLILVPPAPREKNIGLLDRQVSRYAAAGYTTVGAAGLFPAIPNALEIIKSRVESKDSPVRLTVIARSDDLENNRELPPESANDRFLHAGVKFWYDGSPYTGNMFLDERYLDSELMQHGLGLPTNNCGTPVLPKEKLLALVQHYHKTGRQIAIHGQGDRAIRDILDIYENVLRTFPRKNHRHRIEHGLLFPPDQIDRAVSLGITTSWHMNHLYYYGEALRDEIIGPERAGVSLPVASAIRAGMINSLHNDSPMFPAEPFKLVRTAVTRKSRQGSTIGSGQGIHLDEAIKAVTINAAWQMFLENRVGSIEKGKYADLAILSENPRKTDPDQLDKINVLETYLEGRKVWSADTD